MSHSQRVLGISIGVSVGVYIVVCVTLIYKYLNKYNKVMKKKYCTVQISKSNLSSIYVLLVIVLITYFE